RLRHSRKIGGDEAEAFNAVVAEGAPDDHNVRAPPREGAGERATDTVRAADHSDLLAAQDAGGRRSALPMKIAATDYIPISKYVDNFHQPSSSVSGRPGREVVDRPSGRPRRPAPLLVAPERPACERAFRYRPRGDTHRRDGHDRPRHEGAFMPANHRSCSPRD